MTPYSIPTEFEDAEGVAPPRRIRIATELIGVCFVVSAVTTVVTFIIWDSSYTPEQGPNLSHWTPIDDLVGAVVSFPFGFIIHSLLQHGWLFWLGFSLSVYSRSRGPYVVSIIAAIVFGTAWAFHFSASLGI